MNRQLVFFTVALALSTVATILPAQQTYTSADKAYADGTKAIAGGNLAAAREPLEAALKLAPNDAFKLKVNRTLLVPYRELPDIEPMQQAAEYIITNSEQAAERTLTRQGMLAFIHKRGMLEPAVAGYEERLKKSPEDRTTLYILIEAHATFAKNPARGAELVEKLMAIDQKLGKGQDVNEQARWAGVFVKAGKAKEGAELLEQIAPFDPELEAWQYKEAAAAWLKVGDKAKALAAARKSETAKPENRNEQLAYFWHKALADVYLEAGAPKEAIPHYETALLLTKIDGYLKDCRAKLAKARADAG